MRGDRILRVGALLASTTLAVLVAACGSSPTKPSGLQLSGVITDDSGAAVASARVDVVSGANAGMGANAGTDGHYQLTSLSSGSMTLQISAPGRVTTTRDVMLNGATTVDVQLAISAPFTTGRVMDLISQAGFGGVAIAGSTLTSTSSTSTGAFTLLSAASASGGPVDVTFTAPSVLTRRTTIRVPGPAATIPLIPSSLDLASFDQMFRVPRLQRWRVAPPLLIETRAAQFVNVNAPSVTTVSDAMTDAEYDRLVADLMWALPQMTGGAFTAFSSVTRRQSDPGTTIPELGGGTILVVRVVGLTTSANYWGYTRWQSQADGTVTGGIITLDRDFERSGSPYLRSLRTHELGHALGYNHVTSRVSVMNSAAITEPTSWDQDACRVAFSRSPGNLSPDTDPVGISTNVNRPAVWGPPIR